MAEPTTNVPYVLSDKGLEEIRQRVTGTCGCCGDNVHDFDVPDVLELLDDVDRLRPLVAVDYLANLADQAEAVSAAYAVQHGINRDAAWFALKLGEEVGELIQAHLALAGQSRDKGLSRAELEDALAGEVADALCHVLLLARHHGIDVGSAVEKKWLVWQDAKESCDV